MIESQLEKDISADLYQSAYRISENEDIRYNISASSLDSIREKNSLWLQTIPIPSSGSLMKKERLF